MNATKIVSGSAGIAEAVALLASGELVAFPTETVFGLGADARDAGAVAKIYQAKGRPSTNPLIVHVADVSGAKRWVEGWSEVAQKLAERFWPGPLTLVLPRKRSGGGNLAPEVSAGLSTVAIRVPRHPVALSLLRAFGGPIAAPSANRSGFVSPTAAAHVYAELAGRIPLILDNETGMGGESGGGGDCSVGLESTVLDISRIGNGGGGNAIILRPGGITREMIEEVIGSVEVFQGHLVEHQAAASPGMLERHYAPRTPAYRFKPAQWPELQAQAGTKKWERVIVLSWDPHVALPTPHETLLMPEAAEDYARQLYAALRQADALGQQVPGSSIWVLLPDKHHGLWAAVMDRLKRATMKI